MLQTRIIPINGCNSDGDSSRWPAADKGFTRNDSYLLDRVANDKWAPEIDPEDLGGPVDSAFWRLDKLPSGYAGFEKPRPSTSSGTKQVDRYVYGHPNGKFRSINEFYPHFKHLMDVGGPVGCPCKLCSGIATKTKRNSDSSMANSFAASRKSSSSNGSGARAASPTRASAHDAQPSAPISTKTSALPSRQASAKPSVPSFPPRSASTNGSTAADARTDTNGEPGRPHTNPSGAGLLPQGRLPTPPQHVRRRQVDEEGTPDVYRTLIDKVLSAGGNAATVDEPIQQSLSPDWRAGNEQLKDLLAEWRSLPRYTPRIGDIVLFVRDVRPNLTLAWDHSISTWRSFDIETNAWLDRPKWEAGVVTQIPVEPTSTEDLYRIPITKKISVVNSGFRIEPLAEPGNPKKDLVRQYRYIPLHGLRLFSQWQDCVAGLPESEWHPTVRHALMVSNTMCILAPTRFKGGYDDYSGPEATVFCQGAYIGSELIMIGDTVKLSPNPMEQKQTAVTDIMVVSTINARLVNIREANDDDWDEGRPYATCLHVSGLAYTQDPQRGFTGMLKVPTAVDPAMLPDGLAEYGEWYYMLDPQQPSKRLEVPFTRIISRVPETIALTAWYSLPEGVEPASKSSFQAVKSPSKRSATSTSVPIALSRGLPAISEARSYAYDRDPRIDKQAGKTWFWADTRIEALDLHEVSNRFVGVKDDIRGRKQMDDWRKALRALDGKKGGLEEYHAARKKREEEAKKQTAGYGMVGANITASAPLTSGGEGGATGSGEEEEGDEDQEMGDAEDDDAAGDVSGDVMEEDMREGARAGGGSKLRFTETIDISD